MPSHLPLLLELGIKMTTTAAVVVTASVVAERTGPFLGALIASLPTAAGAAYIIFALDHSSSFIAASAVGSTAANAAVAVFSFAYTMLAQRQGVLASLAGALAIWFICVVMLQIIDWTVPGALILNACVFAILIPASARYRTAAQVKLDTRPSDIVWRAIAVASCVAIVTSASNSIGSFASGIFAVFPVVISSLLVIMHLRRGGPMAANVAAHVPLPLVGLGLSFVAVHYLAEPIGVWWSLAGGLATCLAWSGVLWFSRPFRPA